MKVQTLALTLLTVCSLAHAEGGSGGTTGGNPKAIEAVPFAANPGRAAKLKAAAELIRQRLPQNCFPKQYNEAVLAEMDRLLGNNQIFYFPETVLLGSDRYNGDYSQQRLPNGNHRFYHVGAFTEKSRGLPIYFTRDSDKYDVEELAMTFVQDINDHVLQWTDEEDLNSVGAMAMGREKCKAIADGAYQVFAQFPEPEPLFEQRKAAFFDFLSRKLKAQGKVKFGGIPDAYMIEAYTITRDGFRFTPVEYTWWNSTPGSSGYRFMPVKNPRELEVVFSPFHFVKSEYLAESPNSLKGLVIDPSSRTIITEFSYGPEISDEAEPENFAARLNMDSLCDSREFDGNDATRWSRHRSYRSPRDCKIQTEGGQAELVMIRQRSAICDENTILDYFNLTKSVDDYARETYCEDSKGSVPTVEEYRRVMGLKDPEQFVQKLIQLNEPYYRESFSIPQGANIWIHKNIVGGSLSTLPDMLSVVRDSSGKIYSVYVASHGRWVMEGNQDSDDERIEDLDDDDDNAYQCFFQGPDKGKCTRRYYDD